MLRRSGTLRALRTGQLFASSNSGLHSTRVGLDNSHERIVVGYGRSVRVRALVTAGSGDIPERQVRGIYDEHTIVVYQAYSREIAENAVTAGRFLPPFKLDPLTWIQPSLRPMMYPSRRATKAGH